MTLKYCYKKKDNLYSAISEIDATNEDMIKRSFQFISECINIMAWLRDLAYSSRKNKLHLSSFHSKILHASLSTPTPLAIAMTAPHRRYSRTDLDTTYSRTDSDTTYSCTDSDTTYSRTDSDTTYSCTDSNTTSHTSALALSGAEVLRIFLEPLLDCWLTKKNYL